MSWPRHSAKLGICDTQLPNFAECHGQGTRQGKLKKNCFSECLPTTLGKENPKKRKQALPSARCMHSAKHFLKKIKNTFLCRVPTRGTRQRGRHGGFSLPSAVVALGKSFSECPTCGTRQRSLCREGICRQLFAECNCTRQSTRLL